MHIGLYIYIYIYIHIYVYIYIYTERHIMDIVSFYASQRREINDTFCEAECKLGYIECTQPTFSLFS